MKKTTFILASSSPRRLQLLQDIGVTPDKIVSAGVDETPRKGETPRPFAQRMAAEKAQSVVTLCGEDDFVLLAADTVVACGRRVLPKARDEGDVEKYLSLLSGRRHRVYTAVAVCSSREKKIILRESASVVRFARLSKQEIQAYARTGEGIGKAGGYAIQGQAATFIAAISGSYSGIVGLPLFETAQMLKSVGYLP